MNERLHGFLGILNRGGSLLIGDDLRLHLKKADLLLLANDAKEGTRKAYEDKAISSHLPLFYAGKKEELGHAIGYDEISAIGVKGKKAAMKIAALLQEGANQ